MEVLKKRVESKWIKKKATLTMRDEMRAKISNVDKKKNRMLDVELLIEW